MTPGRTVLAILFATYVVAGIWTTRRINATGDEPYYFMAADALLRGEGLDLTARWVDLHEASYSPGAEVPPAELERSTAPSRARPGNYPQHDLALSLVLAPPFAVGGRPLVVGLIALAVAAAVALAARVAVALGASRRLATTSALVAGLSAPALTYSGQVYPDALAPLPVALALCALTGVLPRWLAGPSLAALPLLHLRFWPLALALAASAVSTGGRSWRSAATVVAPLFAVVVLLSAVDLAVYGLAVPHAGVLLFFLDRPGARVATFTRPTGEGLVGIFADRAFGLLPAAPILVLLLLGAGRAFRSRDVAPVVAASVPYLLFVSFLDWTGGFSPQARYFTALVPLFVPLLALALEWRPARFVAIPLGIWTTGQSLVFAVAPWLRYDAYGVAPLSDSAWARFVGVVPSRVFPLLGTDAVTGALALAYAGGILALVAAGWHLGCHERVIEGPNHRTQ